MSNIVVRTLKAAGQLTPVTAAMVSVYNDVEEEAKQTRIQQTFDVISHRIGNLQDKHDEMRSIIEEHVETFNSRVLEKSELHAKLGGMLIANCHLSGGEVMSVHYVHRLLSLSYVELLILLEKCGYVSVHMDFSPAKALGEISDSLKEHVTEKLRQDGLLLENGLPAELEALLEME